MKVGAIIIHSSKYTSRRRYVDRLIDFFRDSDVEVSVIEGVFTDDEYYDARPLLHHNKVVKGHVGCALAHLNAMKLALDKGYDHVFIFEDDVHIATPNYATLRQWINNIQPKYDMLFLTNAYIFEGQGHDGRVHTKVRRNDLYKCSCILGTQAYYMTKSTIKILHDAQLKEVQRGRIFFADNLQIHTEKRPGEFLDIFTPIQQHRFFKHAESEQSILNSQS